MRPNSTTFTLFLGVLAGLPTFGIDMILSSLPATGIALGVPSSSVGLVMSVYLLGLGSALLLVGPASDRFGRKPVIAVGCTLLAVASLGCMLAHSFPVLLLFRVLQGAGASGAGVAAIAIVRDLFEGEVARAKMSFIVSAINVVPMIAPTVGAALLSIGDWRTIYLVPMAGASSVLLALFFLTESAPTDPHVRRRPFALLRGYLRVLRERVCVGYILCNAAANGAVFAYITGSSLFFIKVLDFTPLQYGLVFGASSLSVIGGAQLNKHLNGAGLSSDCLMAVGLSVCTVASVSLLVMALLDGRSAIWVVGVMISIALGFGLISPNAMEGALRPMPDMAGSSSAMALFVQTLAAASCSALVTAVFDGRSALSMASMMCLFSGLSCISYFAIARPAERRSAALSPSRGVTEPTNLPLQLVADNVDPTWSRK